MLILWIVCHNSCYRKTICRSHNWKWSCYYHYQLDSSLRLNYHTYHHNYSHNHGYQWFLIYQLNIHVECHLMLEIEYLFLATWCTDWSNLPNKLMLFISIWCMSFIATWYLFFLQQTISSTIRITCMFIDLFFLSLLLNINNLMLYTNRNCINTM